MGDILKYITLGHIDISLIENMPRNIFLYHLPYEIFRYDEIDIKMAAPRGNIPVPYMKIPAFSQKEEDLVFSSIKILLIRLEYIVSSSCLRPQKFEGRRHEDTKWQ
jgi:hypothetical protein